MTAPDMESIIAAALAGHWRAHVDIAGDDLRFVCECGTVEFVTGSGHSSTATWSRDHQARAVLAAISAAGVIEVQYGLDFGDEVSQQDTLEDVHDERDTILGWIGNDDVQRSDYGPLAPVTRTILTHIGPWTAVEG